MKESNPLNSLSSRQSGSRLFINRNVDKELSPRQIFVYGNGRYDSLSTHNPKYAAQSGKRRWARMRATKALIRLRLRSLIRAFVGHLRKSLESADERKWALLGRAEVLIWGFVVRKGHEDLFLMLSIHHVRAHSFLLFVAFFGRSKTRELM